MECFLEDLSKDSKYIRSEKWDFILNHAFKVCDGVMFNVLINDKNKIDELIKRYKDSFLGKKKVLNKFYPSGEQLSFSLDEEVRVFIKNKKFDDWNACFIEDISFWKGNCEVYATITHEFYIRLCLLQKSDIKMFKKNGFSLDVAC